MKSRLLDCPASQFMLGEKLPLKSRNMQHSRRLIRPSKDISTEDTSQACEEAEDDTVSIHGSEINFFSCYIYTMSVIEYAVLLFLDHGHIIN